MQETLEHAAKILFAASQLCFWAATLSATFKLWWPFARRNLTKRRIAPKDYHRLFLAEIQGPILGPFFLPRAAGGAPQLKTHPE
jgi:hypothetical protein